MEEKKDAPGWLQLVSRPGFCVKNEIIESVNSAASAMMLRPGMHIRELIRTGLEEYEAFEKGCLCLTLSIGEKTCSASVTRMENCQLFLLEQEADNEEFRCLALASLELRMPMNNVLSLADQLLAEVEDTSKASRLNRSLYQMLRILINMSDIGQIASGFRPELRNIPALVEEIFAKAQTYAAQAGIQISYRGPSEMVLGLVDAEQMERAVLNLLSNSMKFTPEGGTIRAELVLRGKQLRLTVRDSGSGIAQEVLDSLFYRYLRQPGIEDSRHGLGLGMALIRSVAANHGGAVLVDTTDGGSRVTMTLTIRQNADGILRSPWRHPDYAGERDHTLVELSDCLPATLYDGTK